MATFKLASFGDFREPPALFLPLHWPPSTHHSSEKARACRRPTPRNPGVSPRSILVTTALITLIPAVEKAQRMLEARLTSAFVALLGENNFGACDHDI